MLTGFNHLTLAVQDIHVAMAFYTDILGFKPAARWDRGAYLSLGDLWICLTLDKLKLQAPSKDYTHYAFSIAEPDFLPFRERVLGLGYRSWQENSSEGESFYFPGSGRP